MKTTVWCMNALCCVPSSSAAPLSMAYIVCFECDRLIKEPHLDERQIHQDDI